MNKRIMLVLLSLGLGTSIVSAQNVSAQWQLESNQAVVGQSLRLTLQVEGADSIQIPQFSIQGVDIRFLSGQPSSSSSIIITNGVRRSTVTKSYTATWSLKSQKAGSYSFNGLRLNVAGQGIDLAPIAWTVVEAQEDERYFLKQSLNQSVSVPGLELEYQAVWYVAESARAPEFNLPLLDNEKLEFVADLNQAHTGRDVFQLQYGKQVLIGVKAGEQINGRTFTTVTFKIKFRPRQSGRFDFSSTSVTFEGLAGTHRVRDFFGSMREEPYYRTLVAKANSLVLEVKDLPLQGKPAIFSGLIGKLKLSWQGAAGPYRVGEPIRLKLALEGVLNKPDLDLDFMVTQALSKTDFSIVSDPANNGAIDNQAASMTRAFLLRARKPGSLVVPELSLNYFDPQLNSYSIASSQKLNLAIEGDSLGIDSVSPAGLGSNQSSGQLSQQGALLNPPGLAGYRAWALPWFFWALPGLLAAFVLSGLGLWRHSLRRQLLLEKKQWYKHVKELSHPDGRLALEEARQRLEDLSQPGSLWAKELEKDDILSYLAKQARIWDEAYFDQGRDNEEWNKRWQEIVKNLKAAL